MFGKKKQKALFNAVDDNRTIVNDFCLRSTVIGFESYRTVEYRRYHKLDESEMIPLLDEQLAKLFAGEVDSGNGDMLDSSILGAAREALPDLERQQCNHIDMLRRLTISRIADRDDIRRIRGACLKEREMIMADYEKICHALDKLEEV